MPYKGKNRNNFFIASVGRKDTTNVYNFFQN